MECLRCGAALGREDYCPSCHGDMKIYKKIIYASNRCFNEGLERAKVRDLSGAAESLQKSLRFNKMNHQARNLLGLVYFEMGETVDAIDEWVIARSLMPENQQAEQYLSAVQSNSNKLDALNQTIKKYNLALQYCRQDSKDLAIIQLKKLLGQNPRLLKGHQLLALLYMEEGNYEQARRSLQNAERIDTHNLITIRYQQELGEFLKDAAPEKKKEKKKGRKGKEEPVAYRSGNETIIRPVNTREYSALGTIFNIIIGGVLGVLIAWFLIVPSMQQNAASDVNQAVRTANDTISTKNQTIKTLETQIEELKGQINEKEEAESSSQGVLAVYEQLLTAYDAFSKEDVEGAGAALATVDASVLSGKASEIYQGLNLKVNDQYVVTLYQQGEEAYQARNYEEAVEKLLKVVEVDETYNDGYAVYYLAQSYRRLEQNDQAAVYYQKVIDQVPGSQRASQAEEFLQSQQQPE